MLTRDWERKEEDKLTSFSWNAWFTGNDKICNIICNSISLNYYRKNVDGDKMKRPFREALICKRKHSELCLTKHDCKTQGSDIVRKTDLPMGSTGGRPKWPACFPVTSVLSDHSVIIISFTTALSYTYFKSKYRNFIMMTLVGKSSMFRNAQGKLSIIIQNKNCC